MGLEQLSEPKGFLKKKRLWLGGFICHIRVGHNAEPLMNEYLRKIICDKVPCSSRINWLWETAGTAASISAWTAPCFGGHAPIQADGDRFFVFFFDPFQRQRCVTSSRLWEWVFANSGWLERRILWTDVSFLQSKNHSKDLWLVYDLSQGFQSKMVPLVPCDAREK